MRTSDAVSDVIAAALLIALVVLGFTVVASYVMSSPLPEKVPKVQFSVRNGSSGDLLLIHEGGEELSNGGFSVLIDGVNRFNSDGPLKYTISPAGSWKIGTSVHLPNSAGARSVTLIYTAGSGETALRSVSAPEGFYVFPSRDPNETVDLPSPLPTPGPSGPFPDSVTTDILPSAYCGEIDLNKVYYVKAHDSTIVPEKPPLFVCDGSNDEKEINDALAIGKGGVVVLLDGHFLCSGRITPHSNTLLKGQGAGVTIIEVKPSTPGGSGYLPVALAEENVNIEGFSLMANGFVMVTASNTRIRNITATSLGLDGRLYHASGNGMFFVWADGGDINNAEFWGCKAEKCHTHGWNMNQRWDGTPRAISNVRLVACNATECGYGVPAGSRSEWITGFDLHEWQDLYHVKVLNCTAFNNWESGFHLEPGARYGSDGGNIGPRTVSVGVEFRNCTSQENGLRNDYASHFFMSGFYLSRDTRLYDCTSIRNANAGYYVHAGDACDFVGCTDDGSTYGWKICKDSKEITITNCRSMNNPRWALWISFSRAITVVGLTTSNVAGYRGYQSILGWYKDEAKYQLPVTGSFFGITATPGSSVPIINQVGSGNTFSLSYI